MPIRAALIFTMAVVGAAAVLMLAAWTGGIAAPSSLLRSVDKNPNATAVALLHLIANGCGRQRSIVQTTARA